MVRNGIDCLEKQDALLRGKRLGLITSVSGVNRSLHSTIDLLHEKYRLTALFAPEHGVRGNVEAGGIVEDDTDRATGIPVYSLYRKDSKQMREEMLEGIDALVYDIQDLGVRYYTFISTMYYAMQACEKTGTEMIVLDRQNPLGGKVEGNLLKKGWESFVGIWPVCMRYGLTAGELAGMIYGESGWHFPLSVIRAEGWRHDMLFPETGNLWVMPSMGIPRFETALVYPGTCLFEGTNLSEGRGTTAPFEMIGAPYVNGRELSEFMNGQKLPGVLFRPVYFTPSASKHRGEFCQGVFLHVTDPAEYRSVDTGVTLLFALRRLYPEDFAFLPPVREGGRSGIELLLGGENCLDGSVSLEQVLSGFYRDSAEFEKRKKQYHLYG